MTHISKRLSLDILTKDKPKWCAKCDKPLEETSAVVMCTHDCGWTEPKKTLDRRNPHADLTVGDETRTYYVLTMTEKNHFKPGEYADAVNVYRNRHMVLRSQKKKYGECSNFNLYSLRKTVDMLYSVDPVKKKDSQ